MGQGEEAAETLMNIIGLILLVFLVMIIITALVYSYIAKKKGFPVAVVIFIGVSIACSFFDRTTEFGRNMIGAIVFLPFLYAIFLFISDSPSSDSQNGGSRRRR